MDKEKEYIRISGAGREKIVNLLERNGYLAGKRRKSHGGRSYLRIAIYKDEMEEVGKILERNGFCKRILSKVKKIQRTLSISDFIDTPA